MCYRADDADCAMVAERRRRRPAPPSAPTQHRDVIDASRSATATRRRRRRGRRAATVRPARPRRRTRSARRLRRDGTTGGYLGTRRVPAVHPQRGNRREGARAVRRPRAAGDPADRVPRRPGAEPDAVRAADDSDQPGDHRRRRAGRLARPRLPARRRVRRGDGARLRRPRPRRHPHGRHLRHDQRVAVVQPRHRRAVRRARPGDVRRHRDRLLPLLERIPRRRRQPRHACCWRSAWARSRRCSPARAWRRS